MTNMPLLSVCLITYNHENYIRQAIEGVLMQKVNFNWELIIAEDCSTDKTRDIILEYKKKHPDFIKLILQEKNVGPAKNWMDLITKPNSKYIAYFEGDDYWTDPLKLQKQVDFLEANADYVMCFHQVKIKKKDGSIVKDFITNVPDKHENIIDLATNGNYIHTPSVVYRNILTSFPFEFYLSSIGDFFLYMLLAEHGKLKYLKKEMAIYRYGTGTLSSNNNLLLAKRWANCLILIFSYSKNNEIKAILYKRYQSLLDKIYDKAAINNNVNTVLQETTLLSFLKKHLDLFLSKIRN